MWNSIDKDKAAGSPGFSQPEEEKKQAPSGNASINRGVTGTDFQSKLAQIKQAVNNNERILQQTDMFALSDPKPMTHNKGKKKKKKRRVFGTSERSPDNMRSPDSSGFKQQYDDNSAGPYSKQEHTSPDQQMVRAKKVGNKRMSQQPKAFNSQLVNANEAGYPGNQFNHMGGYQTAIPVQQPMHQNKFAHLDRPPQQMSSEEGKNSSSGNSDSDESESDSDQSETSEDRNPTDQFLDIEDVELMSDNDSQSSDKKPKGWIQNLYDIWKFLGVLNYQTTLTLLIAYYINSNFASQYLQDLFGLLLLLRPAVIVFYTTFLTCLDVHKTLVSRRRFIRQKKLDDKNFQQFAYEIDKSKGVNNLRRVLPTDGSLDDSQMENKRVQEKQNVAAEGELDGIIGEEAPQSIPEQLKQIMELSDDEDEKEKKSRNYLKEIEFEHPDLASYSELFWQFFFLPVIIFGGLGRLVVPSERKTTVINFSMAQELFIHTIPLGYLVQYNSELVQKPREIDSYLRYTIYIALGQMLFEVVILKIFQSRSQNLERRAGLKSTTRCDDMLRVFFVACIFTGTSVLLGLYTFSNQGCIEGSFMENGICKLCTEYVDINCEKCDDRLECKQCKEGYFGFDRQCIACQNRFGRECQTCTAGGCSVCSEGFFTSYGNCEECRFIQHCKQQQCSEQGCLECEEGYYLDEGICKSCKQAIAGCNLCNSADACTQCVSDYLFVDNGICKCREEGRNQYTDELTGACFCEEGYYMTDRGCLNCPYLIPGCDECDLTTRNTGIPLYALASYFEQPEQQYLDCNACSFGRYVDRTGDKTRCSSCAAKWEGCSYCGDTGGACLECQQTHLLEGSYDEPCLKCEVFKFNCLKCVNKETCTQEKPFRILKNDILSLP